MTTMSKTATLQLQKLGLQREDYEQKVLKQNARLQEYERAIEDISAEINKLKVAKRGQGGCQADREVVKKADKQTFLFEQEKQRLLLVSDKLDTSMRNFREKINAARLDRVARNRVFENLRRELDYVKTDLIAKIEHSNALVEDKEQLDKARDARVRESEDSIIEFEGQYQQLMSELHDLQERYSSQFDSVKSGGSSLSGTMGVEESMQKTRLRIAQLDEWIADGKSHLADTDKKIKELGDVFRMMMSKHHLKDLDELVAGFREEEAKKFQAYSYIQHVNREIKLEEAALADVRRQMAEHKTTEGEDNKERALRLKRIQDELARIAEASSANAAQQEAYLRSIREVINAARRITNSVDSSTVAIETESSKLRDDFAKGADLPDAAEAISEEAMSKCMGLVEEKAKHATRIFSDLLRTSAGRSAATAVMKRDASLKVAATMGISATGTRGNDGWPESSGPTPEDVSRILMDASRGPTRPKTVSPMGATRMPNFGRSSALEMDDDAVPDERPMTRHELMAIARDEIGTGEDLLGNPTSRSNEHRNRHKSGVSGKAGTKKSPILKK